MPADKRLLVETLCDECVLTVYVYTTYDEFAAYVGVGLLSTHDLTWRQHKSNRIRWAIRARLG